MSFFSFNHIYALFAAIASAFVGIKEIRSYFLTKLKARSTKLQSALASDVTINKGVSTLEKYKNDIPITYPQDPIVKNLFQEIDNRIIEIKDIVLEGRNSQQMLLQQDEEKAMEIAVRLSLFNFLFFLSLLITAGLQEAHFYSNDWSAVIFLCHFELLLFSTFFLMLICYLITPLRNKIKFKRIRIRAIITIFFAILITSIIFTNYNPGLLDLTFYRIYYLAFPTIILIFGIPFIALYIRYSYYLPKKLIALIRTSYTEQENKLQELRNLIAIATIKK